MEAQRISAGMWAAVRAHTNREAGRCTRNIQLTLLYVCTLGHSGTRGGRTAGKYIAILSISVVHRYRHAVKNVEKISADKSH